MWKKFLNTQPKVECSEDTEHNRGLYYTAGVICDILINLFNSQELTAMNPSCVHYLSEHKLRQPSIKEQVRCQKDFGWSVC